MYDVKWYEKSLESLYKSVTYVFDFNAVYNRSRKYKLF